MSTNDLNVHRLKPVAGDRSHSRFVHHHLPFLLVDSLAMLCAAAVAVLVRYALGGQFEPVFYLRVGLFVFAFIAAFAMVGLYRTVMLHPVMEIRGIFIGTTFTVLLIGTLTFFERNAGAYSRSILFASWLLIVVFVWLGRAILRSYLAKLDWWGVPTVILGTGRTGRQAARLLKRSPQTGLRVVAMLDDDPSALADLSEFGPVHFGPLSDAIDLAAIRAIEYAIVAIPHLPSEILGDVIERYASGFHHVVIIPDLLGISSLDVDARDIGGILGLTVSHQLLHRLPQATKRSFDLAATCLGGALIAPLLCAIYLSVRLTSRGPAFYSQPRIGLNGATFQAWKFRSMVVDSDPVLHEHLSKNPDAAEEWRRTQKLKLDPRVTRIGKVLRQASLDELPQLWNFIRGDMSLVGPRPIVQGEISRYGRKYSLYKKVRPGITGLWQVSGRNNTTYEERVAFDEYYVRNWSVWLDLYILSRTIKVVLMMEGAY